MSTNKHFKAGQSFVEGFLGRVVKTFNAKPEDRLATLTGTLKPSTVFKKAVKGAQKVKDTVQG